MLHAGHLLVDRAGAAGVDGGHHHGAQDHKADHQGDQQFDQASPGMLVVVEWPGVCHSEILNGMHCKARLALGMAAGQLLFS